MDSQSPAIDDPPSALRPDYAVRRHRSVGSLGATVTLSDCAAGDSAYPPTPSLLLCLCTSGPVTMVGGHSGAKLRGAFRSRDFIVQPPDAEVAVTADRAHGFASLALPYRRLLGLVGDGAALPADGDFGALHERVSRDSGVTQLIRQLLNGDASGAPANTLHQDGAILQVAAALLRLKSQSSRRRHAHGLAPWQLRRACDYLIEHIDREVGLGEVAALVGLSPGHFCTSFGSSLGESPGAWLLRQRMEHAAALMAADRQRDLVQIALSVGYNSHSAFGAAFKRWSGMSPSAWKASR